MTEIPEDVMRAAREAYISVLPPESRWIADDVMSGFADTDLGVMAAARAIIEARDKALEDAAAVAEGEIYHQRYRTWKWWRPNEDGSRGNRCNEEYIVKHCDHIADAIRAMKSTNAKESK